MAVDVFGKALMDYFNGLNAAETLRRDDGYVEEFKDLQVYFNDYPKWLYCERKVIEYAQGSVLDIGGGAGRHSLYLQDDQDLEVRTIDISPLAVEVMKKRGVENVYLMDMKELCFPDDYFDTVLMMFNNFGLAGTVEKTKELLKNLHRISNRSARIIAVILDPYKTDNPIHLAYHKKNREAGRMSGQVKIRIEYENNAGDWFDLLMVSIKELKEMLQDTDWNVFKTFKEKSSPFYGVVLTKNIV